ncbi:involucrin isoform X2 [Notolabrus celidotus]|uniref:involucrin isoform X2 n=1 Tax=Notolabrus celidotus TaxID=1203425 RepID=UPI0014902EFB|nr:involucrin isoform X2 [Notolabrus celidotus]
MTEPGVDCKIELIGLVVLSVALLISLCINIFFCVKQRAKLCRETDNCCVPHFDEEDRLSQEQGNYFHNVNHDEQQENHHDHHEQQENHHDHHEQQENPIYGNISTDRQDSGEVCYEMMTMKQTRERVKATEADLNYASLDLKRAKKHKKRLRHQHQGRNSLQDQPSVQSANAFLEVDMDMDARLPSRDTSTMVSHSSIYLNSQQIAQEAEEMERERGINTERENMSWEGIRSEEDGRIPVWNGERESEERTDLSNGNMCPQLLEADDSHTNHCDRSFDRESVL